MAGRCFSSSLFWKAVDSSQEISQMLCRRQSKKVDVIPIETALSKERKGSPKMDQRKQPEAPTAQVCLLSFFQQILSRRKKDPIFLKVPFVPLINIEWKPEKKCML